MIVSKKPLITIPKSTGRTVSRLLYVIVIILTFPIINVICTSPSYADKTKHIYQVDVKLRYGTCSSTIKVVVEASNSFDAQKIAENQARYMGTSDAVRYKQLK